MYIYYTLIYNHVYTLRTYVHGYNHVYIHYVLMWG